MLFRQLYETLVRVDCHGRVRPGLAASWRLDANGRTWIVTLRENARFSDGAPVTAADVRASWTRDGSGDELRPHVSRLVAIGRRSSTTGRLAITLRSHRVERQWRLRIPIWRSPSSSPIRHGRSERDPAGSHQTITPRSPERDCDDPRSRRLYRPSGFWSLPATRGIS